MSDSHSTTSPPSDKPAKPSADFKHAYRAFRRWTVEHGFRVGKQEAGLMHSEGRDYTGRMRHLILALVVLGFVAAQTERLRGGIIRR